MTIKKNSNRAKQAIASAQNVVCFSLTNNFFAKPLADKPYVLLRGSVSQAEFLASELAMPQSRISLLGDRYTIHVHSNLWYEFVTASETLCLCGAPMHNGLCSVSGCVCSAA